MTKLNSIAVFCGGNTGNDPKFIDAAVELGALLVTHNITLIYGAGNIGLMGVVADAVINDGGRSIGVIPQFLVDKEVAHQGLTTLHVVDSMHERKAMMAELSEGFILLPGGAGSLDEFFEIFTWGQLGLHKKPCGILNVNHYYDDLIKFIDNAVEKGFIHAMHRDMIQIADTPEELLRLFENYHGPTQTRWLESVEQA